MAKRRAEVVAASLLTAWTDADTAMQIVGTSLGLFGEASLDPTVVLSTETPLRNALFDVLLSLVEGGALEIRTTNDRRYAFRWRDDVAIAGLSTEDSPAIDLAVPSPYLEELERARAERDEAMGRADFAEALAAERERMLRLAGARGPEQTSAGGRAVTVSGVETRDESVLDVLYAQPADAPSSPSANAASIWEKPPEHAPAEPAPRKAAARKAAPKKAPPKKAEPPKAPRRATRSRTAAAKKAVVADPDPPETSEPKTSEPKTSELKTSETKKREVVYLTPPEADATPDIDLTVEEQESNGDADDATKPGARPRWSGYAIDKSRKHLASVDRLADEG